MALAVNLSALPKCAHAILDSDGLSQLVARAVATKDSLVMKVGSERVPILPPAAAYMLLCVCVCVVPDRSQREIGRAHV